MKTVEHQVEFCVIGGGLAGLCAALAAARHGVKTLLMHERPVLGGNASSEIRMWVCGAHGFLETGLIEEIRLENLYRNTMPNYSVWDSILYEKARFQTNLTLLLNCSCQETEMAGSRIKTVRGYQMTTQQFHRVEAQIFADCSGDSVLAPLTGAEFRSGREARSEFNESIEPETADRKTMGMSCLIQIRETGRPQQFIPPTWANKYTRESDLPHRLGEFHSMENFWWLELGGEFDSINDTEILRDELLKAAFGVWDYHKNHAPGRAMENWLLEWVGFLPGKRESRRYVGDHLVTENDILAGGPFPDLIAYGGWTMDDHHPGGLATPEPPNIFHPAPSPYGLPYRALYSRNIDNLMFAGRNISVTHAAMSSTRVMATCALLGQAAGTGAMLAIKNHLTPREVGQQKLTELQHTLMDDDCTLPGRQRPVSQLSGKAGLATSNQADPEMLRNGFDRPSGGQSNAWSGQGGDWVEYRFDRPTEIREIRLIFDSNLDRPPHNLVSHYPLNQQPFTPSATLVQGYTLSFEDANGKWHELCGESNNYQRLVRQACRARAVKVRLTLDRLRQPGSSRVFAFEVK